jgi:hypothetical protein
MTNATQTTQGRLRFHLTIKSSNAKTGPIPVSTSSKETCPATCSFRSNGCYAESGPLALHWAAVTHGVRGVPWPDFLNAIRALPQGQLWRHNQAGDLYAPGTRIGQAALRQLVDANRGKRGFTYSHHPLTRSTIAAFKAATADGFTVNASCESEAAADAAVTHGLRAVYVVPSTDTRRIWRSTDGNTVVKCPAQVHDGMTCKRCKLCAQRPQDVIVAFMAHGSGYKRVDAVITAEAP